MYMDSADLIPCGSFYHAFRHRRPSERQKLLVRRLNRRRTSKEEKRKKEYLRAKMELKNLRLYRENQIIIKENEKLRRKALLLRQENQALLSQLRKKFPYNSHNHSAHNEDE